MSRFVLTWVQTFSLVLWVPASDSLIMCEKLTDGSERSSPLLWLQLDSDQTSGERPDVQIKLHREPAAALQQRSSLETFRGDNYAADEREECNCNYKLGFFVSAKKARRAAVMKRRLDLPVSAGRAAESPVGSLAALN